MCVKLEEEYFRFDPGKTDMRKRSCTARMFTAPEAKLMQFNERTKQNKRYIPHTLKKIHFSGVTQKSKAVFLWSPSMTKYPLLLQILHFEMQIWTWREKKLLWIKVDLVWKASAQAFRTRAANELQHRLVVPFEWTSCNARSQVWSRWHFSEMCSCKCVTEKYAERNS